MVARSPLSNAASHDWSCLAAGVLGNVKWASPAAVWARRDRTPIARAVNVVIPANKANETNCFNALECVAESRLMYRSLLLEVLDDSNALPLRSPHDRARFVSSANWAPADCSIGLTECRPSFVPPPINTDCRNCVNRPFLCRPFFGARLRANPAPGRFAASAFPQASRALIPRGGSGEFPRPPASVPLFLSSPLDTQYETRMLLLVARGRKVFMPDKPSYLVQGTLDMLILKTLACRTARWNVACDEGNTAKQCADDSELKGSLGPTPRCPGL